METLIERLSAVRERIAAAARRANRDPAAIRLVGVTKAQPVEAIRAALAAGLHEIGENRVQEAEAKMSALAADRRRLTLHLIGHLQTNKAKKAATLFDMVHSVDSLRLAQILDRHAAETTDRLPVLLQVNVSGEMTKSGFDLCHWETLPDVYDRFCADVEQILALPHLEVRGLMTIAPWGPDPEQARPVFRAARRLRDSLALRFPATAWRDLSMGMTDDFEVAIEEGATIVRIGRAIFGER
ncbi:YggS family pyridoxal phosphate-dependent enzyme [Roseiflexus castenholzii]|jgi:pyridoxal phosphate enzyme (YggS family)|uniref:Pyridoxal phosphate homeostasis protein n=1 Tax=Roseiflexus castenholzii (strain DSM 13941 / HLO8) TaxID=383372 RepID=A7NQD4_ROSCS|nr:YggS family pyridoxal phosphate-dependent enzyme [Roseiflexus castenholzii]ABU59780.1 alanine racemase domain protein [Roseiflexus castenholzii DSM 13941]